MKVNPARNALKRLSLVLLLAAGVLAPSLRATPVTISYDFKFDQNGANPSEIVTGNVTISLNTPAPSFNGYTTDGVVDGLDFSIVGLPGYDASATNYVKMLFNSGKLTYLFVSNRSDFALQGGNSGRKEGYILGLVATDLLTGTGLTVGQFGSYFDYLLPGRYGINVVLASHASDIEKVTPPAAGVPETASTLGLFGLGLLGLIAGCRRFRS
ncbi:MAG TPA: hypothetical protein VG734_14135 [Lacunisphaera sp.]|nr:hypothetical protein [Lacunisphaera sp.]